MVGKITSYAVYLYHKCSQEIQNGPQDAVTNGSQELLQQGPNSKI